MLKTQVLLIEDEATTASDLRESLERLGFSVAGPASSVREAEALAAGTRPDIALIDIELSGEADAVTAAEEVRALEIPVIFLTSVADDETLERARITGPYGYILKPVNERDLQLTIDVCLYRHSLEKSLRESEQKLREITSFMGEGIYVLDDLGRLTYMNPEAEQLLGWTEAELLGRKVHEIFHRRKPSGDVLPPDECMVHKACKTGLRHYSENDVFIKKDGSVFPVSFVSTPVIRKGRTVASITVFQNASSRQKIEEEKIKAGKIESMAVLARGVAHDFNNFLTAILGSISFAKNLVPDHARAVESLAAAEKAGLQAKDLAHRLLTFWGGGEPVRKTILLGEIIASSANLACSGSAVRCETLIPAHLWPVEADEAQISQVVHNLITGAKEAIGGSGTITISADNIELTPDLGLPLPEGNFVRIRIGSEGKGRARQVPDAFLKPGGNAHRGETWCLELERCHSILKSHGGLIAGEAGGRGGSSCLIFLPASHREIQPAVSGPELHVTGKARVLIMDDEEIIRLVSANMLKHNGYEVEVAGSGEEAVSLYEEEMAAGRRFDAVILDLTVRGGMGGAEAITKLIALDPEVTAILSSGYSQDPMMTDFRNFGFKGVLPKPYKMSDLCQVLRETIGREAALTT